MNGEKINSTDGFTINWIPDYNMPSGNQNGLIILYSDDSSGNSEMTYFEVDDNIGQKTISSSDLNNFLDYGYVRVFYARSYTDVENISSKEIEFLFLGYAWSKIYFI